MSEDLKSMKKRMKNGDKQIVKPLLEYTKTMPLTQSGEIKDILVMTAKTFAKDEDIALRTIDTAFEVISNIEDDVFNAQKFHTNRFMNEAIKSIMDLCPNKTKVIEKVQAKIKGPKNNMSYYNEDLAEHIDRLRSEQQAEQQLQKDINRQKDIEVMLSSDKNFEALDVVLEIKNDELRRDLFVKALKLNPNNEKFALTIIEKAKPIADFYKKAQIYKSMMSSNPNNETIALRLFDEVENSNHNSDAQANAYAILGVGVVSRAEFEQNMFDHFKSGFVQEAVKNNPNNAKVAEKALRLASTIPNRFNQESKTVSHLKSNEYQQVIFDDDEGWGRVITNNKLEAMVDIVKNNSNNSDAAAKALETVCDAKELIDSATYSQFRNSIIDVVVNNNIQNPKLGSLLLEAKKRDKDIDVDELINKTRTKERILEKINEVKNRKEEIAPVQNPHKVSAPNRSVSQEEANNKKNQVLLGIDRNTKENVYLVFDGDEDSAKVEFHIEGCPALQEEWAMNVKNKRIANNPKTKGFVINAARQFGVKNGMMQINTQFRRGNEKC